MNPPWLQPCSICFPKDSARSAWMWRNPRNSWRYSPKLKRRWLTSKMTSILSKRRLPFKTNSRTLSLRSSWKKRIRDWSKRWNLARRRKIPLACSYRAVKRDSQRIRACSWAPQSAKWTRAERVKCSHLQAATANALLPGRSWILLGCKAQTLPRSSRWMRNKNAVPWLDWESCRSSCLKRRTTNAARGWRRVKTCGTLEFRPQNEFIGRRMKIWRRFRQI